MCNGVPVRPRGPSTMLQRPAQGLSGRSGRRPGNVFGGHIGWNRDSPVLTPLGDYNIKREDGGIRESPFHQILPPKTLSGRLPERPESPWAGLCNVVQGPRALTGTSLRIVRGLCNPHFFIQQVVVAISLLGSFLK